MTNFNIKKSIGKIWQYAGSSLLCVVMDNAVFYFLSKMGCRNGLSLLGGRVVSVMLNFLLLQRAVHRGVHDAGKTFPRYLLLVVFSGTVVWGLLGLSQKVLPIPLVLAKMLIESVMFFINYFISESFIFTGKHYHGKK